MICFIAAIRCYFYLVIFVPFIHQQLDRKRCRERKGGLAVNAPGSAIERQTAPSRTIVSITSVIDLPLRHITLLNIYIFSTVCASLHLFWIFSHSQMVKIIHTHLNTYMNSARTHICLKVWTSDPLEGRKVIRMFNGKFEAFLIIKLNAICRNMSCSNKTRTEISVCFF